MIGCLTETTTCVVAKPLVHINLRTLTSQPLAPLAIYEWDNTLLGTIFSENFVEINGQNIKFSIAGDVNEVNAHKIKVFF